MSEGWKLLRCPFTTNFQGKWNEKFPQTVLEPLPPVSSISSHAPHVLHHPDSLCQRFTGLQSCFGFLLALSRCSGGKGRAAASLQTWSSILTCGEGLVVASSRGETGARLRPLGEGSPAPVLRWPRPVPEKIPKPCTRNPRLGRTGGGQRLSSGGFSSRDAVR